MYVMQLGNKSDKNNYKYNNKCNYSNSTTTPRTRDSWSWPLRKRWAGMEHPLFIRGWFDEASFTQKSVIHQGLIRWSFIAKKFRHSSGADSMKLHLDKNSSFIRGWFDEASFGQKFIIHQGLIRWSFRHSSTKCIHKV
jgi:hypothetical protein